MKDLKDVFESTLKLEELGNDVRYKPGDEITVDQKGKDITVTVIEVDKKTGKTKVKSSDGTEWFLPVK